MTQEAKPKEEPTVTFQVKGGHASDPQAMEVHAAEGDLKPWDLDTEFRVMQGRYPRQDGPAKVTGRAKYSYDVKLPGMLWGRMVRATIPAGTIVSIDTSKAEALPGVKAVWTTESKTVRFAGQDVAAVAAISQELAEDAARLVRVTYEPKPHVTDMDAAQADGAPLVYEEGKGPGPEDAPRKGNVLGPITPRRGARGDIEKGFAEAEVTVEASYRLPTHTHSTLETHGVVAHWEGEQLTVYASTQGTFSVRAGMAEALGIDLKNVTVITEHMGGGFGSKLAPSAVGSQFAVVACKLAKDTGAPVKLMLSRNEDQLCTGNAPGAIMKVRVGAKKDGTLTAIHHHSIGSPGVASGGGTGNPVATIYSACPNLKIEEHTLFTNAGPAAPLRAPGHSQGAFAIESTMDMLAHKLGLDPLEVRRKNIGNPVRTVEFDKGAKAIGWERRNETPGGAPGPKKRGIGMANGSWFVIARDSGVGAEVRIHRDGSVEGFSGAQDLGTGFRTAMAVVAAEVLGLRPEDVRMNVGNTNWPPGPSSGGSVTINSVAPAMRHAADVARGKLFEVAAPLLEAEAEELHAAEGKIFVKADPTKSLAFKKVAAKMSDDVLTGVGDRKKQFETYRRDLAGVQFAEVEVDVETGVIRVLKLVTANEPGFPVNSLTAESQMIGGMIQGASWALLENRILDREVGTMVNPNLESYKILNPSDMFEAVPILVPVANLGNNTSTAGIGEPPIVPTLGAISNAVFNATGVHVRELPMTPDRVLAALAEAERRG